MNTEQKIEQYLNSLHYALSSMSISEKAEIITEIKSHINECLDSDQDIDYILGGLGEPNKVAERYLKEKGLPLVKKTSPGIMSGILKWFCITVITLFLLLILGISTVFWIIFKKESSPVNLSITAKDGIIASANGAKITINEDGISTSDIEKDSNTEQDNSTSDSSDITHFEVNNLTISKDGISIKNKNSKEPINVQVGKKIIKNKSMQSFTSYGDLNLYNSSVNGDLTVFGTLDADGLEASAISIFGEAHIENSNIKDKINVNGKLVLKSSKVQGQTQIFGDMEARSTQIDEEIIINGRKAKFVRSSTKNIIVRANKSEPVQKITLRKESTVDGDIIFESGNGVVEIDDTIIVKGKITGAQINKR